MSRIDPIFAALDAMNEAKTAHVFACETRDEENDTSVRICNAACDHAATVRQAMMKIMPTTMGGLRALAAHYSRWCEPGSEDCFIHIAYALEGCESKQPFRRLSERKAQRHQAHACPNPKSVLASPDGGRQ